jgi:hypothetical protein
MELSKKHVVILLKGRSLSAFVKAPSDCDQIILVNNFERELIRLEDLIYQTPCIHFINRLPTAPMSFSSYKAIGVEKVVFMKPFSILDYNMFRSFLTLKSISMKVEFLPKFIQKRSWGFGKEYSKKFPNAGILAIIYALEYLRPQKLSIFGLDFYEADYLYRRKHQNPLSLQKAIFNRLGLVNFTERLLGSYPGVKVELYTKYHKFNAAKNVTLNEC